MSDVEAQRPSKAPVAETNKVVVRNLDFYYGQTRALKDVSFNLYAGEVTGRSAHRGAASPPCCAC